MMNREIKFRGFSKELNSWVYGFYQEVEVEGVGFSYIFWKGKMTFVEANSVGQFSNFYDKNLSDIYEGDILSDWTETDEGLLQSKCQVFWNEPTGSWHLDNSFEQDQTCSVELWEELNDFKYEVTGNVYETPKW